MKKIKLTSKLSLNKIKVSELNNTENIHGGAKEIISKTTCTWSRQKDCHSTPVCCLSYTCETMVIPCLAHEDKVK